MYYTRERNRYDWEYQPVKDLAAEVAVARAELKRAKKAHRIIGGGFLSGIALVLAQFPFSLLGNTPLTVSTALLGGVATVVFGFIWIGQQVTNDFLPDVGEAEAKALRASNLYTKELLEGVKNDVD